MPIRFGVSKDAYDVTDPKVHNFLTNVLDEVMQLFPSEVIHIGGDELKYEHWKNSESIQLFMKKNDLAPFLPSGPSRRQKWNRLEILRKIDPRRGLEIQN